MSERKFGSAYFEVLSAIKDSIDGVISSNGRRLNLSDEQIRQLISAAKDAVDNTGGSALRALYKSAE
jgi:hypothetical protein